MDVSNNNWHWFTQFYKTDRWNLCVRLPIGPSALSILLCVHVMFWSRSLRCFLSLSVRDASFSGISKTVETPGTWGIQTGSVDSLSNISSKHRNVLLLRCLHPSLDHEFMPFWQQLSTTNITILCLSFKVKYSAAFKCNAGAPTGSELSIR